MTLNMSPCQILQTLEFWTQFRFETSAALIESHIPKLVYNHKWNFGHDLCWNFSGLNCTTYTHTTVLRTHDHAFMPLLNEARDIRYVKDVTKGTMHMPEAAHHYTSIEKWCARGFWNGSMRRPTSQLCCSERRHSINTRREHAIHAKQIYNECFWGESFCINTRKDREAQRCAPTIATATKWQCYPKQSLCTRNKTLCSPSFLIAVSILTSISSPI